MSLPDRLSIVSSVLSIIAFILGLLGMAKEKKRQTYSFRKNINFNIENRNIIQTSSSHQNNTQIGSDATSFVLIVILLSAIFFIIYEKKIESIIIYIMIVIAITGVFTALRVIRGKESYLPSRNPLMQILFLLSPVIVIISYPLSCYLINHTSILYHSKMTAALSLITQTQLFSTLTILATAILLLVQFCSLLIPLTHGLLRMKLRISAKSSASKYISASIPQRDMTV